MAIGDDGDTGCDDVAMQPRDAGAGQPSDEDRPADARLTWRPPWPIAVRTTLAPLRRGPGDPTLRHVEGTTWWATRCGNGPVTVALEDADGVVRARAWGPGATQALQELPRILGADDDLTGFDPAGHPVMAAAFASTSRWRMLRTERVVDALVPAVLEQRVTGREARRAWRTLVLAHGDAAPGPAPPDLRVAPSARQWAAVPSWDWHVAGVDPGRARTIRVAVERAAALERLTARPPEEARSALATLPGIGVWTAAEVAARAWGDADAVPFGDFHLARDVVWALTGRDDGTDQDLAEALAPWPGHRGRAARLVRMHAGHRPRRGPRATITDHRRR